MSVTAPYSGRAAAYSHIPSSCRPFFGFVTPTISASGLDLEHHYQQLSIFLDTRLSTQPFQGAPDPPDHPPRSILDHPLNARLRFPALIARALSMKARLRERLSLAYREKDWDQMELLAGKGSGVDETESLLGDLRVTIRQLHDYHRQLWMSMYRPFGWEGLDLRYGGLEARLETMHLRIVRFLEHVRRGEEREKVRAAKANGKKSAEVALRELALGVTDVEEDAVGWQAEGGIMLRGEDVQDSGGRYDETVTSLPELEVELHVAYPSAEQLLDYHRVSRPTYC